jgi:hypothetical protein
VAQRSEGSDNFVAFSVSQRGVWFFGTKTSEVWYDAGSTPMPLAPIPGVFIEEGIAAPASVVNQFDNAIIWLGQNQWGGKIVRRANGYIPTRISTHGVEIAMERYPTVADAVGWAYREQGHEFYILTFPTANATWAYDAATNMWHERAYLDPVLGTFQAQLQICHCYAFGKHLVGDRRNGNIYEQSLLAYTDNGAPIRSERRAPILSVENKWMFHNFFQLDFEPGVGLDGNAGVPPGINPMAMLKWSNDGGHTFSNEYRVPLGLLGQYETRAIWRRLGRSRNRVYDVAVADPVRRAWIGAYIDVEQGTN